MSETLLKKLLLVEQASLAAGPAIRSVEDGRRTLAILDTFARQVSAAADELRARIAERAADKLGYDEAIEAYVDEAETLGIERDDALALIDKRLAVMSLIPGGAAAGSAGDGFAVSISVPAEALALLSLPAGGEETSPRAAARPRVSKGTAKPTPAEPAGDQGTETAPAATADPVRIDTQPRTPEQAVAVDAHTAPEGSPEPSDTSMTEVDTDAPTVLEVAQVQDEGTEPAASVDDAATASPETDPVVAPEDSAAVDEPTQAEAETPTQLEAAPQTPAAASTIETAEPQAAANVVPLPATTSIPAAPPARRSRLPAFLAKPGS